MGISKESSEFTCGLALLRHARLAEQAGHELSFYPGLLLIWKANGADGLALTDGLQSTDLGTSNTVIYGLNECGALLLHPGNIRDYVMFFFDVVRGSFGSFTIVQPGDRIPWTDEVPDATRTALHTLIQPLTYHGVDGNAFHRLSATVFFRSALFATTIRVAPHAMNVMDETQGEVENLCAGQLTLCDEVLLLEHFPIEAEEGE